jgi:hypothetical protein
MLVLVRLLAVPPLLVLMRTMLVRVVVGVRIITAGVVVRMRVLVMMPMAARMGMHPDARMLVRVFMFVGVFVLMVVGMLVIALHVRLLCISKLQFPMLSHPCQSPCHTLHSPHDIILCAHGGRGAQPCVARPAHGSRLCSRQQPTDCKARHSCAARRDRIETNDSRYCQKQ